MEFPFSLETENKSTNLYVKDIKHRAWRAQWECAGKAGRFVVIWFFIEIGNRWLITSRNVDLRGSATFNIFIF